ncbi:hypothetical protein B7P43_G03814 [Cryptotermes secundus]|uniref:Reelin domain-containing protein n=1 Tax=Cryptotermes secundus TaxID=105785 RepID=A0A2J7QAK2_9NEOP|nr:uncharacterized protein LOC111868769 [Cryptotermes secundus]PNF25621.1 hypothetical protein B7P43_G03814 [Cryptotermes secundus]
MTSLTTIQTFIFLSVLILFQRYAITTAASFHAVDCNATTSQADFQYASSNGQAVGTFQVNNGTFDIYQELNGRPTWAYYRGTFTLTNGGNTTIPEIPNTDKVLFEINFNIGNRTVCKRFHVNNF